MSQSALHPCVRCAGMQKTCCQRAEIVVTTGDVERIARHVARDDFHEWRAPADPSYAQPNEADPRWLALTLRSDGKRRALKRAVGGDCTFLGAQGCSLPREVRPLVCRLYPLDYTEKGLIGEAHEYCPTAALRPPGGRMSQLLRMDELEARRWHRMLYQELEQDLERDEDRPHLRSA